MRILLTNDDGIHAPGLAVLEAIAARLSDDVWVVAPETEQSGASHSLTLHVPLRVRPISPRRFAVQGTPTDCVVMGVVHLLTDKRPDLVLSGVNRGANIADDVTYSGTIAGAMEGTVLGVPSIALSQTYGRATPGGPVNWSIAERFGPDLIKRLVRIGWPKDVLLNVNFPDVPEGTTPSVEVTVQGQRDQSTLTVDARTDARGIPYYWLSFERKLSNPPAGTDLRALYSGRISVTPLHLDLSHRDSAAVLAAALARSD